MNHLIRLPNLQPPFNNKRRSKEKKNSSKLRKILFKKPINTRELEEIGIQIHPYREGIECLYCRLELRGRDEGTVSGRGYILVLLPRSAITFVPVIMC